MKDKKEFKFKTESKNKNKARENHIWEEEFLLKEEKKG